MKKKFFGLVVLMVSVATVVLVFGCEKKAVSPTLWENTKVGMTVAEVQKLYPEAISIDSDGAVFKNGDEIVFWTKLRIEEKILGNYPYQVNFAFDKDGGLGKVQLVYNCKEKDISTKVNEAYDSAHASLTSTYGQSDADGLPSGLNPKNVAQWSHDGVRILLLRSIIGNIAGSVHIVYDPVKPEGTPSEQSPEPVPETPVVVEKPVWEIVELKDEFGDLTGAKRIAALADGTFSNSATSNSTLNVHIFVDGINECDLLFYEYGRPPAASFYNDSFSFSIKDGEGERHSFYWSSPSYSSQFVSVGKYFLPILKKGGTVKAVVREGSTTYNFEIDATGFPELFASTFEK